MFFSTPVACFRVAALTVGFLFLVRLLFAARRGKDIVRSTGYCLYVLVILSLYNFIDFALRVRPLIWIGL
ncbi:hypothetical protein BKG61_28850 [Mycobacterium syngnathidarum]|uniref:Uncharacterized protein n=1 Tax=Mycobacterium syngnathidarum TaxID=1908205 RepID=A0A1S1JGZ3_9MYCO|nr:hypothetical protein BKG61_28850 [Mycobacterium syngnathidarum]